jgi:hypothetical protein
MSLREKKLHREDDETFWRSFSRKKKSREED